MMKNFIPIILTVVCFAAKAQNPTSPCPALQAFNGEWRYVNGQDTIRMYFRYQLCDFPVDGKSEILARLWGWHEYKKGNVVVESNYANRFMTLPSNFDNAIPGQTYSLHLLMPQCDDTKGKLIGGILDLTEGLERKTVKIQYNAAKTQIQWWQEHGEGYGFMTGKTGMTLPKYFVLTKQ